MSTIAAERTVTPRPVMVDTPEVVIRQTRPVVKKTVKKQPSSKKNGKKNKKNKSLYKRGSSAIYKAYRDVRKGAKKSGKKTKRVAKNTGRSITRSYKRNTPKIRRVVRNGGKNVAKAVRWTLSRFGRLGRFIVSKIKRGPYWSRRAIGWIMRGASVVVSSGFWMLMLGGVIVLALAVGVARMDDYWDAKVYKKSVRMSRSGRWNRPKPKMKTITVPVTEVVETEVEIPVSQEEVVTAAEADDVVSPDYVKTIEFQDNPISHDALYELLTSRSQATSRQALPDVIEDDIAVLLWGEMADHYIEVDDPKAASYFLGRKIAAEDLVRDVQEFRSTTQRKYVDAAMAIISELNREDLGHELVPSECRKGLTDETRRLRQKYAMDQNRAKTSS